MKNRGLVLMYHIIDEPMAKNEFKYCCSPANFARQMQYLVDSGHSVLSMDAMTECILGQREWPEKPVAITFDDGFDNVYTQALPVLANLNLPATLYALSDHFNGDNFWMNSRGFPNRKLITQSQLIELDNAGITIGSHTANHGKLPQLGPDELVSEIRLSKSRLEDILGKPVQHFAYPYGLFDDNSRQAVIDAKYLSACSTVSGFNRVGQDVFAIRRIEVFGWDTLRAFRQKMAFGTNEGSFWLPVKYYASRLVEKMR